MIIVKDLVSLKASGKDGSSLKFLLSPAVIETLDLELTDLVQITIHRIFKLNSQNNPSPVDIPMPGKVVTAGGVSIGVTIRASIVRRLQLQENDEIEVSITLLKKGAN